VKEEDDELAGYDAGVSLRSSVTHASTAERKRKGKAATTRSGGHHVRGQGVGQTAGVGVLPYPGFPRTATIGRVQGRIVRISIQRFRHIGASSRAVIRMSTTRFLPPESVRAQLRVMAAVGADCHPESASCFP
jgi:hypothetical protein